LSSTRDARYRRLLRLIVVARKSAGLTQSELGRRLRKPQSFVSKFELGERRLDLIEFLDVTTAIGCDPADLLREIREAGQVKSTESKTKSRSR
jgi:transcriptional regulator with XRE-family HTH domain